MLLALALVDLLRCSVYILMFVLIVQAVLSWVNPGTRRWRTCWTRSRGRSCGRSGACVPPIANVDLSPLVLIVVLQVLLIPLADLRSMAGGLF